jgi:hypothetical protein
MVALAVLAVGCSFDRRSGAFRCDSGEACGPERVCQDGWCVSTSQPLADGGGDGDGDGDAGGPDGAFACPADCTRCDGDLCVMDCSVSGSCATEVVCPAGVRCKVECGTASCGAGIDCSAAASCRIECPNDQACAGLITCGPGFCRVECGGLDSCTGGIDCSGSCACDTFCTGAGSCAVAPSCTKPMCTSGVDCTSVMGQCNEC